MNEFMFGLKQIDIHQCDVHKCPYLKNTIANPAYDYIGHSYCGLTLKQQLEMCPIVTKTVLKETGYRIKLEPVD